MSFRQLDCFLTVAQKLSFSKAARQLFLSQSAVSQQVSMLESDLSIQLFYRTKHSVSLTPSGKYFYEQVLSLKSQYQNAEKGALQIAQGGVKGLMLGYDGPISEPWFASSVAKFRSINPSISVQFRKEPVTLLTNLLQENTLDIIVTHDLEACEQKDIFFHPLLRSQCCVFVPDGHKFQSAKTISLSDLNNEILIVDCLPDSVQSLTKAALLLQKAGINFDNAHFCTNGDVIFSMVEAGLGITIQSGLCREFAQRYNVSSIELDIGTVDVVLGLAWKSENVHPFVISLAKCIQGTFAEEVS